MNINIAHLTFLFASMVLLGVAMFYAFSPYGWICEFHSTLGMASRASCQMPHWVPILLSMGFLFLSIMSYRDWNVKGVMLGRGAE